MNISETLIIGFDHCNEDIPCLTVMRRDGRKMDVVSTFLGTEAYDLYSKLIGVERYPLDSTRKEDDSNDDKKKEAS